MEKKSSNKLSLKASICKRFFSNKKSSGKSNHASKKHNHDKSQKQSISENIHQNGTVISNTNSNNSKGNEENLDLKLDSINIESNSDIYIEDLGEISTCVGSSSSHTVSPSQLKLVEDIDKLSPSSESLKLDKVLEKGDVDKPEKKLVKDSIQDWKTLSEEYKQLGKQSWYWGPLTRVEAEQKLVNSKDGSFLIRDSSDNHYLFSLSFRSNGRTLHTRIEYFSGNFSFYINNSLQTYSSVVDLINMSMKSSKEEGLFCYSRTRDPSSETYPVLLISPFSRFNQIHSLQFLCRFTISQLNKINQI